MEPSADDPTQRASIVVAEAVQAAILEAALDPIILMDARGRVRDSNPAAERVFGYARAAVLGREMAALIVPEHLREAHRRGLARYVATGASAVLGRRLMLTAVRASGEEFPIELAIAAVPGHEGSLFAGYARDLSEQRRAEARDTCWPPTSPSASRACCAPAAPSSSQRCPTRSSRPWPSTPSRWRCCAPWACARP